MVEARAEPEPQAGVDPVLERPVQDAGSAFQQRAKRVLDHVTFFVSAPIPSRAFATANSLGQNLGRSNYSYTLAMTNFVMALRTSGATVRELGNPAIYRGASSLGLAEQTRAIHLAFYPPENLRLLKGAENIISFAWEFDRLRDVEEATSSHAFASQCQMLNLASEIWTPSNYGAVAIRRGTRVPVRVIPAPVAPPLRAEIARSSSRQARQMQFAQALQSVRGVPLCIIPNQLALTRSQAILAELSVPEAIDRTIKRAGKACIFLTVFNPHDARKGLRHTLEAFVRFAALQPEAMLILKTSSHDDTNASINERLFTHQLAEDDTLCGQYVSNNVFITNQSLSPRQLSDLYSLADFYVSTSRAEGQNLPLLEAMTHGVVPLSVTHTAMADYIDGGSSICIESDVVPLSPQYREKYGLSGAHWYEARDRSVFDALQAAAALTPTQYRVKSRLAVEAVRSWCSPKSVMSRIFGLLGE